MLIRAKINKIRIFLLDQTPQSSREDKRHNDKTQKFARCWVVTGLNVYYFVISYFFIEEGFRNSRLREVSWYFFQFLRGYLHKIKNRSDGPDYIHHGHTRGYSQYHPL